METILLSTLLPAAVDIVKNFFGAASRRFVGISVDDQVKLQTAEVAKLEAISKLDSPHGVPSQWVVDLRASFRYIAAGVVILIGAGMAYLGFSGKDQTLIVSGLDLAGMPFGFIFGERLWQGLKGPMSK